MGICEVILRVRRATTGVLKCMFVTKDVVLANNAYARATRNYGRLRGYARICERVCLSEVVWCVWRRLKLT
jgi:hypothetical protein